MTFDENANVAKQGGNVARVARVESKAKTGKKVVSKLNAKSSLKEIGASKLVIE